MKFEITGVGFCAATDATDAHVVWVEAETEAQVEAAVEGTGSKYTALPACISSKEMDYTLPEDLMPVRQKLLECRA